MDYFKIGIFLQTLRKEKGLTQLELADILNVSNKTVSKWECGDSLPEIPMLKTLADFYDLTIDEILNGERKQNKIINKVNNENNTKSNKYTLWMIISFSVLFLGYLLTYIIGYTTYDRDLSTWISILVYFISIVVFILGNYFSNNKESTKNNKKYFVTHIYISILLFFVIVSILFSERVTSNNGNTVLSLESYFVVQIVPFMAIFISSLCFYFVFYLFKRVKQNNVPKKLHLIFKVCYLLLIVVIALLYVFSKTIILENKITNEVIYSSMIDNFSNVNLLYFIIGNVILLSSIILGVIFIIKKRNLLLVNIISFVGIIILNTVFNDLFLKMHDELSSSYSIDRSFISNEVLIVLDYIVLFNVIITIALIIYKLVLKCKKS